MLDSYLLRTLWRRLLKLKQSELTQLYVLLNRFREEYVPIKPSKVNEAFDIVDDAIDNALSYPIEERTINLI